MQNLINQNLLPNRKMIKNIFIQYLYIFVSLKEPNSFMSTHYSGKVSCLQERDCHVCALCYDVSSTIVFPNIRKSQFEDLEIILHGACKMAVTHLHIKA